MFSLKIFSNGKKVTYKGEVYTVDYVTLVGVDLYVSFKELDFKGHHIRAIATEVDCEPTIMKIPCVEFRDKYIRRFRN